MGRRVDAEILLHMVVCRCFEILGTCFRRSVLSCVGALLGHLSVIKSLLFFVPIRILDPLRAAGGFDWSLVCAARAAEGQKQR